MVIYLFTSLIFHGATQMWPITLSTSASFLFIYFCKKYLRNISHANFVIPIWQIGYEQLQIAQQFQKHEDNSLLSDTSKAFVTEMNLYKHSNTKSMACADSNNSPHVIRPVSLGIEMANRWGAVCREDFRNKSLFSKKIYDIESF